MIKRGQHLLAFLLAFFVCTSAFAQTFTEDFEKFGAAEEPPGWLDTSDGKFTTSVDPDVATNIVYGAKFTISKQRSVHRAPRTNHPSGGAISTLSGRVFSAGQLFEYRGRFYRATDASLLGFTFFSMQPEIETHRMVALWRRGNDSVPTMQLYRDTRLHAHSEFTPRAGQWYRFASRVEGARIRVRFWADGTAAPQSWSIDFTDAEVAGESGRIGLWAGAGTTYFDDLHVIAKSSEEVDTVGPAIIFSESGERIANGATELFNRDVKIDVRALDASGIRSLTVTVDGNAYTPGATIATERTHTLRARAVDNKGNASEASVEVVVDKTPPVIAIAPLPEVTSAAVTPQVSVTDQTATTVTVRLDGAPFTAGSVVDAEGTHTLAVTATDAVGWTATKNVTFTIDRTAPSLVFRENGQVVTTSLTRH
ncbi:MAG TPA: hypothetical protein VE010_24080, partial [Thermoanaerobaculia bacterium]|nr:hypothetical protein [Thermoanaerobaculia bacterium]